MTDLFLGVDGGGTKTHAALMDSHGNILGLGVAATGNWERVGLEASSAALADAMDAALAESGHNRGDVTSATFALAGVDWDSDAHAMQNIIGGFGLGCTPTVMNDAFAVLYAGTPDGVGCASIAGTGGKTVAVNNGPGGLWNIPWTQWVKKSALTNVTGSVDTSADVNAPVTAGASA